MIDADATDVQNPRVTPFRHQLAVTTSLPTVGMPAAGCVPADPAASTAASCDPGSLPTTFSVTSAELGGGVIVGPLMA